MKCAKFLRTANLKNICECLLLNFVKQILIVNNQNNEKKDVELKRGKLLKMKDNETLKIEN